MNKNKTTIRFDIESLFLIAYYFCCFYCIKPIDKVWKVGYYTKNIIVILYEKYVNKLTGEPEVLNSKVNQLFKTSFCF